MRILLHDLTGHHFQIQLSRQLAKSGHQVLHSYASFFQGPKGILDKQPGDPAGFNIEGLELDKPFQKYSFVRRLFQEMSYGRLLLKQIQTFQPEVVMFANVPSEVEWVVQHACRRQKIKTIHWVQDVYGVAIGKLLQKKIPGVGYIIGQVFLWFDRQLARHSDQVILISEDFQPLLAKWRVPAAKVQVIPNWAPLTEMPVKPRNNGWAKTYSLADGFNFLYAGTLGMKHNPALLAGLAKRFSTLADPVRVIVVSEGLGADWLRRQKQEQQLDNLILLPYQPFACLPEVLGAADVLLAILEPDAGVFSVPSKVLSYLCAQRPLLLAVPPENQASRVVVQSQAGFAVSPMDVAGFGQKAETLYGDAGLRKTMGGNGRAYAEEHFDLEKISRQFEALFSQVV